MMIKANGEYLDFNGDIEIESQIKLFEDIESVNGDYSYDIEIQDNGHNRKVLGIPRADTVKTIYQAVPSEVIDDTGQSIYLGKLQVNRISGGFIYSTFYSGNTDWFAQLSDPITSLPLYKYDTELTVSNIQASWLSDEGLVFPIFDSGTLVTRSFRNFKVEDFVGCFYLKTLFKEIFNSKGIKIKGDLLSDFVFNNMLICANGRLQDQINSRSSFAKNTLGQLVTDVSTPVTFDNDYDHPYFDGDLNNYTTSGGYSRYTADIPMVVEVELKMRVSNITNTLGYIFFQVIQYDASTATLINHGRVYVYESTGTDTGNGTISGIKLDTGDEIRIYSFSPGVGQTADMLPGSTFKVTPTFLYKSFGNASVPDWSMIQLVTNVFKLFNVIPHYEVQSKTLTLNLFEKIKTKDHVNISDSIEVLDTDFSEFISNYGKVNSFTFSESNDEDLSEYNIKNFVSLGEGSIEVNNDYINDSADVIELDFSSPVTYLNQVFDISMDRINFTELNETVDLEITSVTDSSTIARFNASNADDFIKVGDLIRIIGDDIEDYNGDWIVATVTSSYFTVNGLLYSDDTSGTASVLRHQFTDDDNVYIFINVQNQPNTFFSSNSDLTIETTTFTYSSLAYFTLLSNATPINNLYKQSLSFGAINNPLSYQITILQTYWHLFDRILNDPVKLLCIGNIKRTTYDKIKTFLNTVRVETNETTNLYYLNRITGYKGSERPCELELIKLN